MDRELRKTSDLLLATRAPESLPAISPTAGCDWGLLHLLFGGGQTSSPLELATHLDAQSQVEDARVSERGRPPFLGLGAAAGTLDLGGSRWGL